MELHTSLQSCVDVSRTTQDLKSRIKSPLLEISDRLLKVIMRGLSIWPKSNNQGSNIMKSLRKIVLVNVSITGNYHRKG